MARSSIPVDLFNPGQVFACLGLLETANQLLGGARAGFDWRHHDGVVFYLEVAGEEKPIEFSLAFLASAQVEILIPTGSSPPEKTWGLKVTHPPEDDLYPFLVPDSNAALPAAITGHLPSGKAKRLIIDHWMDSTKRDTVKLWAGAQGKLGAAFFNDALELAQPNLNTVDPFNISAPQSGSLRFDWRRDYTALDAGFSPNEHKSSMSMVGYPIVEMFAAIGLGNARPLRVGYGKLEYRYRVLGVTDSNTLFDPIFLRAALGCADLNFPCRDFLMQLDWPGQENQARCIVNVIEETRG
jgi:CRISPR-associated protein Csx14